MPFPGYHIATPDKAMLVSGRKSKDDAPAVYLSQGKWVMPMFRTVQYMPLKASEVGVTETCPTLEFVNFTFTAVITFHVGHDKSSIIKAARLYLTDPNSLVSYAKQIFTGHLRSIAGGMAIKAIIQDKQALAKDVLEKSEAEMANMGIVVKSFQIQDIKDDTKYLDSLSAASVAGVKRDAEIAQAAAAQASVEKQQESEQAQAQARRNTAVKNAKLKAEVDAEEKKAEQAGPLAQALARQEVIDTETETARREVELTQQKLQTTQIKPAEAARDMARIAAEGQRQQTEITAQAAAQARVSEAEGEAKVAAQAALAAESRAKATIAEGKAEATKVQAIGEAQAAADRAKNDAAAAAGKVSIEQLAIEKAPAVAEAIAGAFRGSNMTYLNGLEGGMKDMNSLVGYVPILIEQVRRALNAPTTNGEPVSQPVPGTPVERALQELKGN